MLNIILKRLKHLDAYSKPLEDFRVKTLSGAIITIICTLFTVVLFFYEYKSYASVDVEQELFVDLTRNQKLTINLDMTFPHLPCQLLTLDIMDVSGENQNDIAKGLKKMRIDKDGRTIIDEENKTTSSSSTSTTTTTSSSTVSNTNTESISQNDANSTKASCPSCYGAEAANFKCCNTCGDVRAAYRQKNWHFSPFGIEQCKQELEESGQSMKKASEMTQNPEIIQQLLASGEGCRLNGHLEVNKVAGNFHIAPGLSFQQNHVHMHDIKHMPLEKFNTAHYFDVFSFGDEYPNQLNPLERKNFKVSSDEIKDGGERQLIDLGFIQFMHNSFGQMTSGDAISYSYFLKVVPTTYEYLNGRLVNNTYQYSVTKSFKKVSGLNAASQLPGVFVNYELSPIMVKFVEKSKSFTHFLTGCCAIIGGLFTISGMLDAFTYKYYNMYKKHQLNKLT